MENNNRRQNCEPLKSKSEARFGRSCGKLGFYGSGWYEKSFINFPTFHSMLSLLPFPKGNSDGTVSHTGKMELASYMLIWKSAGVFALKMPNLVGRITLLFFYIRTHNGSSGNFCEESISNVTVENFHWWFAIKIDVMFNKLTSKKGKIISS